MSWNPAGHAAPPVERHGPLARVAMVLVGVVFALLCGALTVALVVGERGLGACELAVIVGVFLAIAAYGAWLAWRGLRGYSRPSSRVHRAIRLAWAVLMLGGAAAMISFLAAVFRMDPVRLARAPWWSPAGGQWGSAMFLVALPVQLLAHELGHVVAGRLVGFRFVSLQVGPFRLDRQTGRWRVTLRTLELGLGGRAEIWFDDRRRLPQRMAVFAGGGPAANLAVALLAFLAAWAVGVPDSAPAAVSAGLLGGCAWSGLALGVLNLVPVGGAGTDGARILTGLRAQGPAPRASDGARATKKPPFLRAVDRDEG